MRLANLANGAHQIQFTLVDAAGAELTNPEAMTLLVFSVVVPPNSFPKIGIVSPSPGATFPPGLVAFSLVTANFSIGLQGQPHIHFFLDNDPTPYEFFRGPDEDTGVLYRGKHTHLVHWKSSTSFHIFRQPSGSTRSDWSLSIARIIRSEIQSRLKRSRLPLQNRPAGNFSYSRFSMG